MKGHAKKSPFRKPSALRKMAAIAATRLGNENRNNSNRNIVASDIAKVASPCDVADQPASKRPKIDSDKNKRGGRIPKDRFGRPKPRSSPLSHTNTTEFIGFDIGPPPGVASCPSDMLKKNSHEIFG